jgi:NADH-quinone oxidoreductase subunit N
MQYITPLLPAYPELLLLGMVCVILIADLFVSDDNRIVTYALTQATLAGCFLITYLTAAVEPVTTFSDMFVDDLMADVLKLLVYLGVIVMLVYSRPYIAARGRWCWCSRWCSSSRAWASSWVQCRSTCGCRTSITARRRQ